MGDMVIWCNEIVFHTRGPRSRVGVRLAPWPQPFTFWVSAQQKRGSWTALGGKKEGLQLKQRLPTRCTILQPRRVTQRIKAMSTPRFAWSMVGGVAITDGWDVQVIGDLVEIVHGVWWDGAW